MKGKMLKKREKKNEKQTNRRKKEEKRKKFVQFFLEKSFLEVKTKFGIAQKMKVKIKR